MASSSSCRRRAGGGVTPTVLGAHPVEHVDVLGVEDHPHLGQREAQQLLQVLDARGPGHVGRRVEPLAPAAVAAGAIEPQLLPVAQGSRGEPGQLGHLADAQDNIGLPVGRRRRSRSSRFHRLGEAAPDTPSVSASARSTRSAHRGATTRRRPAGWPRWRSRGRHASPARKGALIKPGKKRRPVRACLLGRRELGQRMGTDQVQRRGRSRGRRRTAWTPGTDARRARPRPGARRGRSARGGGSRGATTSARRSSG